MVKYKIRITRQARAHLQDIRDYIATTFLEPGTARKMVQLLRSDIQSLSEMPQRIKPIDEEPWGGYGFRRIRVKNYYVYFWINEEKKQVQIIAVIYVKRDQITQLEKMIVDDGDDRIESVL